MGSYFKPLRRKIGVLMLVVACALTVGWIRSEMNYCVIRINGRHHSFRVGSHASLIEINFVTSQATIDDPFLDGDDGRLADIFENGIRTPIDPFKLCDMDWRWDWADFHFGGGKPKRGIVPATYAETFVFPFWSIVIPLTLLSAWLLLSKPPAKIEPLIPEIRKP